ncbi:MAG: hypothetical protein ACSLFD_10280 [Solirubrobacterales bacterium]
MVSRRRSEVPRLAHVGQKSGIPWAGEIKIRPNPRSVPNRYYRHGVPQAALYADFIRNDSEVDEFFGSELGIDRASECKAALIVPLDQGDDYASGLDALEWLASCFGVSLLKVDDA